MSVDYHKMAAILQITSWPKVKPGETQMANPPRPSESQLKANPNYHHPFSCSNTFNQLFPHLPIKGTGDRVKHFTNIQNKGQRNVHEELFLHYQFCYLRY